MKRPKVSIIVPVYNAERSISECIGSIQRQTFTDFELIIVDDGSTDASANIIDDYAREDSRIKTVHKTNTGVSAARNVGMEKARGEYLAFVDADDTIGENRIKAMVEGAADADLLISGLTIIDEKRKATQRTLRAAFSRETLMIAMMEDALYGYIVTKLIKKKIVEDHDIRFDENIHWREDDVFVTDYLVHARTFAIISDTEYYYKLPSETKTYKGMTATQCAERLFEGYEKIFGEKIPDKICQLQAWTIKGEIERLMLSGQTPSKRLLKHYKTVMSGASNGKRTLTQKIIDYIILSSRKNRKLSIWLIKNIHRVESLKFKV